MKKCLKRQCLRQDGFTLVELMVAMILGLIIIGGVISVFLSTKQSYRTNQGLSEIQENTRMSFELLARDIRSAGLTGCVNNNRIANVVNSGGADWWLNWNFPVIGYDASVADPAAAIGTAAGDRLAGTDSIAILGAEGAGLSVANHNPTAASFQLNESSADLQPGDIIIACDPDHATVMQITNYTDSNVTLVHNSGTGTPGNCSKGLGFPSDCSSVNGNPYEFGANSQIAKVAAFDWYVGVNPQGGSSLYRVSLDINGGAVTASSSGFEMIRNITNMQIQYHVRGAGNFVDASTVAADDWAIVDSVRVTLTTVSEDNVSVDLNQLTRTFASTTTIRNRAD